MDEPSYREQGPPQLYPVFSCRSKQSLKLLARLPHQTGALHELFGEWLLLTLSVWIRKEPYQDIAQIQDGTRYRPLTWRCIVPCP